MPSMICYKNATIHTESGKIKNGYLLVTEDGIIAKVGSDANQFELEGDTIAVDLEGAHVLPGFIDVHVHGGAGHNVMNATYEDLAGMSLYHAAHGTTAFLASTGVDTNEGIHGMLANAVLAYERGLPGAELAGIHMEGPYLNPLKAGGMNADYFRPPNVVEMKTYLETAKDLVRMVTLAPEMPGATDVIRMLSEQGIIVSMGHSDASYEQTAEAVANGASHTTHHYNAMRPLHHREPGLTGAGLSIDELTTEIIADGIHAHPAMVKLLFTAKDRHRVCAITDSVYAAGLADGVYGHLRVKESKVVLRDNEETLAGSSLTMIDAFRNVLKFTGLTPTDILPAFTSVPAREAGVSARKGTLTAGKDADFIVADEAWTVLQTYVKGNQVFCLGGSE